jgi:flavorubredoxin
MLPSDDEIGVTGYEYRGAFNDNMHWIQKCIDLDTVMHDFFANPPSWYDLGRRVHATFNQFVIDDEETVMIDSGVVTPNDELVDLVDEILDGRSLDHHIVSHPDVDHSANTQRLVERYPDLNIIAPRYGESHELYYLNDARLVAEGDTLDTGKHAFTFHDAPFVDSAVTVWMTEETTRTFFPVDFPAWGHQDTECGKWAEEIPELEERMVYFMEGQFWWFKWSDPDKLKAELTRMIEEYDPVTLASQHTEVVRTDAK